MVGTVVVDSDSAEANGPPILAALAYAEVKARLEADERCRQQAAEGAPQDGTATPEVDVSQEEPAVAGRPPSVCSEEFDDMAIAERWQALVGPTLAGSMKQQPSEEELPSQGEARTSAEVPKPTEEWKPAETAATQTPAKVKLLTDKGEPRASVRQTAAAPAEVSVPRASARPTDDEIRGAAAQALAGAKRRATEGEAQFMPRTAAPHVSTPISGAKSMGIDLTESAGRERGGTTIWQDPNAWQDLP